MSIWVKTNWFVKQLFPKYVWDVPNTENKVFLTFDDGPTPEITEWVLAELKLYGAKATFFCIGDNISKHPDIFKKVIEEDHSVGNHTQHHLNGWNKPTDAYLENVAMCGREISKREKELKIRDKKLFRPPYGKIKPSQSSKLRALGYEIIMWDIVSYDFDRDISAETCLNNVLSNVRSGSIIVFHDSVKAEPNLRYALPLTLKYLRDNGFVCEKL